MKYVKCSFPDCVNYVPIEPGKENECYCEIHKRGIELLPDKHGSKLRKNFAQNFTFENIKTVCRGICGYKAYDEKGENVGVVFPTGKRYATHDYCELAFFERYWERYGVYHRIQSHGERIPYAAVDTYLMSHERYTCFVD